jgi:periplasmic protein TonB
MRKILLPLLVLLLCVNLAKAQDTPVFTLVEEMPQYPGGDNARIKFLQDNIIYPKFAKEAGIQGTTYVTFVVNEDGSVSDVKIARGIGGGCDEEAVRVTRLMPKWEPGRQSGKPVRVQFNMPVKFTLTDGKSQKQGKKQKGKKQK